MWEGFPQGSQGPVKMLLSEFMSAESGETDAPRRYNIRKKIGRGAFAEVRRRPRPPQRPECPQNPRGGRGSIDKAPPPRPAKGSRLLADSLLWLGSPPCHPP